MAFGMNHFSIKLKDGTNFHGSIEMNIIESQEPWPILKKYIRAAPRKFMCLEA
jgi:hypothetical protein